MSWGYRPSLDGLRALAMYLIVLFHAGLHGVGGSFISVNLFFVLSGFLVTNVLINEQEATGRIRLGNFFARRVRRLLPAAVVAIVAICLVFLLAEPVSRRLEFVGDARSALLYFANWHFIARADDYFAPSVEQTPFLHFWTLSIEEQFYILFPILVLVMGRFFRRRMLAWTLGVIFIGSIAAQYYWAGADPNRAYYGTDARVYQLAIGCLLALLMRRWPQPLARRGASVLAVSGMAAFLVLCTSLVDLSRPTRGVIGTLACAMIIAGLMMAEDQWLGRVLSWRLVVWLGTLSYATYLFHWPIILLIEDTLDAQPWTVAVLAALLATSVAALSAEVVEQPVRRAKVLNRWNWRVTATGVSASVLVAAFLVPATLSSQRIPILAASTSDGTVHVESGTDQKVPAHLDWKKIAADSGPTHNCRPDEPDKCIVVRGSGPTIVLVGDSHARMLTRAFVKLAHRYDFTLVVNDHPSCMWQENLQAATSLRSRTQGCTDVRVGWYKKALPELHPDLVVLVERARSKKTRITQRNGRHDPRSRAVLNASRSTVQAIEKAGARALMVENIIAPNTFDPARCLTSHNRTGACTVPITQEKTPYNGYFESIAADSPDAYTVNLNPAFCPDTPVCQPIVGGKVVWRNETHLAAAYATSRRAQVWKLIRRSGALRGLF